MSFGDAVRKAMDTGLLDNKDPEQVPAGRYSVRLAGGRAGVAKSNDKEYAVVVFEILSGPTEGTFEGYFGLGSPMQMDINGNALAGLGVNWTEVAGTNDLDKQINGLNGTTADISVAWNNGFLNINVHGSRPAEPVSDIPANGYTQGMEDARKQQADFAAQAATQTDDTLPF